MNKEKPFDCIKFKRESQARFYEETKGMTPEQRSEHLRRCIETGPLADFWKKVQKHAKTAPKAGRL